MSDIPAGTGLGSSISFTTALLSALHAYSKDHVSQRELAEQACHIEIDLLGEETTEEVWGTLRDTAYYSPRERSNVVKVQCVDVERL
jgi:hypothetical protein